MIPLLCAGIIIGSMGVGAALGRFLHTCEEKEHTRWNAPLDSPEMNQTAPGADWGTWSTTT